MHPSDAFLRSWHAELALDFERRGGRTVLAARRHEGPLVVQKPLYPEGEAVCHAIVVHPPAGIAGGDELELDVRVAQGGSALLTTPGAGKWYRSGGAWARQALRFDVGEDACLEWLPQETIVFDGALANLNTRVRLARGACFIGWEVLCLGRTGSGERFANGECRLSTEVSREEQLLWRESGRIEASGRLMQAAAGLGESTVCATLYAAAEGLGAELVAACRSVEPASGRCAVTLLPGVLLARYLGDSSESARHYLIGVWRQLRPWLAGRDAVEPRIWST